MPIRLVIADDHPAFRTGIRSFLERSGECEVVAEASDGEAAVLAALRYRPDVVLLDLDMPTLNGIGALERIHAEVPETNVLVLSAYADETYIFGVLDQGAAGYLTKQESLSAILDAVRGVARGETGWLSRRIASLFLGRYRSEQDPDIALLSERERDVIALLAHGMTNAEIGEQLFISENTVKTHVNRIYDKLDGVRTRAQAVAWAWKRGLAEAAEGV
ncbi:MAG: response regulator transcription factor [Bacteroidota bacterium]